MDLNNLSPYIRIAMDSVILPPCTISERVIFDYELLYVKEGEALITIEDTKIHAHPGDVFLFKPKIRHSIHVIGNSNFRQPHIHFDLFYQPDSPDVRVSFKSLNQMTEDELKLFREDATSNPGMCLPNRIKLQNIKYFEEMLFDIIKEYEMRLPFYEINVKGLFIRLWTYLLRENHWNNNPAVFSNIEELIQIKDYLASNINIQVSLEDLARQFNMSKYHLVRIFKQAFHMTPIHYHQMVRLQKTKEMIQFTNMTFTQISGTMGFGSINAFSRAFRKLEGVPPSFYR
jgi:AraC-like DNA-binding protein